LLGDLLRGAGYGLEIVEAHQGAPLPTDLGAQDLLVVMGGPMGVADIGKPEHPWLEPVAELLRRRLAHGWPNIGVCLGMQLIAHAAGAKVAPMAETDGRRRREVGWGPLRMVGTDAVTAGLPAEMEVLHWHGDACELPRGATLLASTPACPVQMFRLGSTIGMQFHPEIDGATACIWAAEDAEFVRAANGPDGVFALQTVSPAAGARSEKLRRRLLAQVIRAVSA
jgi:GMP synthase-like glutamine amidotransferase